MYFCRNLIFASNLGLGFSHFLPSSFHRKIGIAVKSEGLWRRHSQLLSNKIMEKKKVKQDFTYQIFYQFSPFTLTEK